MQPTYCPDPEMGCFSGPAARRARPARGRDVVVPRVPPSTPRCSQPQGHIRWDAEPQKWSTTPFARRYDAEALRSSPKMTNPLSANFAQVPPRVQCTAAHRRREQRARVPGVLSGALDAGGNLARSSSKESSIIAPPHMNRGEILGRSCRHPPLESDRRAVPAHFLGSPRPWTMPRDARRAAP